MFEGCVLGVDPGVAAVGLAAVGSEGGKASVLWSETLRTEAGTPEAERLRRVHRAVTDAISEQHPSSLAVERLMWGRNVGSAMSVARASGVVLLAAAEAGIPAHEYAPLDVKMASAGSGSAGKEQVRRALEKFHGLRGVPEDPDAADAAAVAFCHVTRAGFAAAVGEASHR